MVQALQLERDRAYRKLLDLIIAGELDPRQPLSERKLAEQLGIGRMPVREALRDLSRDGVVDVQLARGTFIRRLTPTELREIYEVRQALEGMAARLAAQRGATEALLAFGPRFRVMLEHLERYSSTEIDDVGADFHLEVFNAARNANLARVFEPLRIRHQIAFGLPRYFESSRATHTVGEHMAILEAIGRGDGAAAQQQMWEHLASGLTFRLGIFERAQQEPAPPVGRALPIAPE